MVSVSGSCSAGRWRTLSRIIQSRVMLLAISTLIVFSGSFHLSLSALLLCDHARLVRPSS